MGYERKDEAKTAVLFALVITPLRAQSSPPRIYALTARERGIYVVDTR
jgi:hypothetical protein